MPCRKRELVELLARHDIPLIEDEEAREKGVGIAPGTLFSTAGRYGNCIRLNAAFWSERVDQALETVGGMAGTMLGGAT